MEIFKILEEKSLIKQPSCTFFPNFRTQRAVAEAAASEGKYNIFFRIWYEVHTLQ